MNPDELDFLPNLQWNVNFLKIYCGVFVNRPILIRKNTFYQVLVRLIKSIIKTNDFINLIFQMAGLNAEDFNRLQVRFNFESWRT